MISKEAINNIITLVTELGRDETLELSEDTFLSFKFDMLENRCDILPVCNVSLCNRKTENIEKLLTTVVEDGSFITQGSVDLVYFKSKNTHDFSRGMNCHYNSK